MQSEFGKLPSMLQFSPLNNLPAPVRALVRPMLFASVGLHALLLFVPFPGAKQESKPPQEKTVKVTQLPPASKSKLNVQSLNKVKIAPPPKPVMPALRPNAITIPSIIKPRPIAQPTPEAAATPKPVASVAPGSETQSTPATNNPFSDFPRYANAKPGSFESLSAALSSSSFQTSDPLSTVEAFFMSELPKQQFEVGSPTNLGSVKVVPVSKGGVTKYLHLLNREGKGTVFLLLDSPIDVNSLPKDTKIQTEPPEKLELTQLFTDLADQVNFVTDHPEELNDPTSFSSATGIEFDQGKATSLGEGTTVPLAQLDALLQSQLGSIGFTLSAAGSYGGGTVYQITKNSYTRYLVIAPTQDGGGWVYVFEKAPGQ